MFNKQEINSLINMKLSPYKPFKSKTYKGNTWEDQQNEISVFDDSPSLWKTVHKSDALV